MNYDELEEAWNGIPEKFPGGRAGLLHDVRSEVWPPANSSESITTLREVEKAASFLLKKVTTPIPWWDVRDPNQSALKFAMQISFPQGNTGTTSYSRVTMATILKIMSKIVENDTKAYESWEISKNGIHTQTGIFLRKFAEWERWSSSSRRREFVVYPQWVKAVIVSGNTNLFSYYGQDSEKVLEELRDAFNCYNINKQDYARLVAETDSPNQVDFRRRWVSTYVQHAARCGKFNF